MSKSATDSSNLFSSRNLILGASAWALLSLLFFLFFSVTLPGEGRPLWYSVGTSVLESLAYLGAALLCFRNWRSTQILSGRSVWLLIGLGMLSYFIGNLFFSYWELVLQKSPDVSPGDLFYIATYLLLALGMLLAVLPRRLNLELWQWGVVAAIGTAGTAFSFSPLIAGSGAEETAEAAAVELASSTAPAWVIQVEEFLSPFADFILSMYTIGDILLLVLASALLLAFWGGRSAQSWRMIAAASISLYIADMWFNYATANIPNYESGSLLEVFWIFSGVLFGVGAVLEYDLSTRSRRSSRRRSSSSSASSVS
ncbi:MAG: hypothetical protein MH825_00820 [Cyanobacteria bacterium]|nr:hypothetical protein [Cyanobacteriota bacterium]